MRICLVSFEYPPETGWGGIGTQTRHKARGLSRRGHDLHVVSASGDHAGRISRDGAAIVHRIAAPDLGSLGYDGPAFWLSWSIAAAKKVRELDDESPFDIIHFPEYGGEGFIFQTDERERNCHRCSLQLHGPLAMFAEHSGWPPPGSAWHRTGCFLEKAVIHNSSLVMASSRNTAAFCATEYGYPLDEIEVIYSGVDTDAFCPQPSPPDSRSPRILFVGKPSQSKGFPALVQAVLALRKEFPLIVLRTVGKVTEDQTVSRLQAQIAAAGADASFEFRPNLAHDQLPAEYGWSDLLAGPSRFEPGPGNVYLEAMSCGKPIVACSTGGTPEAVLDGQTGILVPPDSPSAIRDAIARLAGDQRLRNQFAQNAREWVMSQFSMKKYLDRVESLYDGVARSRGAA